MCTGPERTHLLHGASDHGRIARVVPLRSTAEWLTIKTMIFLLQDLAECMHDHDHSSFTPGELPWQMTELAPINSTLTPLSRQRTETVRSRNERQLRILQA